MCNNLKNKTSYNIVKLLLADDHELFRFGLRSILDRGNDFAIVQDAINGHDAVELALIHKPDVILMDVKMPFFSGIEAATIINIQFPEIKVILMSAYEEEGISITDLPENIKGFLLKDIFSDDLVEAVRKVNDGYYVFSNKILANYSELIQEIDDNITNYIVLEENPCLRGK